MNIENVECPYCFHKNDLTKEIYGKKSGERICFDCEKCEMNFLGSYEIKHFFTVKKCDCLNGGECSLAVSIREVDLCGAKKIINTTRCNTCGQKIDKLGSVGEWS